MTTAVLYDIHGNLPALEAVLEDARRIGAGQIVVGGDVVPGPMPSECLTLLRDLTVPTTFIRGNGERVVGATRATGDVGTEVPRAFHDVIRWNAAQLDAAGAAWIGTWPLTARLTLEGIGDVLFCHATPQNDVDIFTRLTPEERLLPLFDNLGVPVVICGHTHMQFDRMVGSTRVINAGSVGMSFQGPGAFWLEIGDEVRLRRTDYDLEAAARRIRATSYPQAEAFAATNVLSTPTEAVMLEAFGTKN